MNKFEKLIEYIINDEDQKARELFHNNVVEKSRDIYESIMSEEDMEEAVHGDQVEELANQMKDAEAVGEDDEAGEEFSFDQDGEDDGEVAGELPADDSGEEFGRNEEEDKIMNIDAKLDELLAKFDEIMGDEGHGEEPAEKPAMDMGHEQEVGAEEEPAMFEGENPFAKSGKSGKSGSAQSGKSGSAMSGKSGKRGSGKAESKQSTAEMMREYVDRIGDIYGGAGDATEGDAVGAAGKKTSVNTTSVSKHEGPDFGGHTASSKGGEQDQDGTSPAAAPKPQEIKSGNRNVPGGKAGSQESTGKEYSKASDAEGQTTDGKVAVATKSVQAQNTGKK